MEKLDDLSALKEISGALEKGEVSARKRGWVLLEDAKKTIGL